MFVPCVYRGLQVATIEGCVNTRSSITHNVQCIYQLANLSMFHFAYLGDRNTNNYQFVVCACQLIFLRYTHLAA